MTVREHLFFKSLTIALTLALFGSSSPAIAAPKKGSVCKKIAQTSGKGSKKVTCSPVTQLKWVSTPVKPLPGSIFAPAKIGQQIRITSADFRVENIDFDIGGTICAENAFNEGCSIGPKSQGIVDLNSEIRWIGINIEVENGFQKSFSPTISEFVLYLVQEDSQLIENNIAVVVSNSLFDLRIESGESASGVVVFSVPKSIVGLNPLLVIRHQIGKTPKDFYFQLDW
jgi:hypothetical protein